MTHPAYQLRAVEYAYGDEVVLRLDALQVERGAVTALLGANGSGKSTLLDILGFLRKPAKAPATGAVCFFGAPVRQEDYPALRRRIAYVQQKPYLFNTSVLGNIELGLKLRGVGPGPRRAAAEKVIEQCRIEHLAPRRAHALSGGEVQKVALARALVLAPEVLLLDEPFAHLDAQFRQELEQLLEEIRRAQSPTVVLATHERVQAQQLAEHIISLDHGRLIPTAALNLFQGAVEKERGLFDTGRIKIHIPAGLKAGERLAIEANHLVISRERLSSSMRNRYAGRVKSLREEGEEIHLIIAAGEEFHAIVTHAALQELGIQLGDTVWVSFKSTAVKLLP